MVEIDPYLEKITWKKQNIIRGLESANRAGMLIRVIDLSVTRAHSNAVTWKDENLLQQKKIPEYYRSHIEYSSIDPAGRITIPGIFKLLDSISDEIRIIAGSIIEGIHLLPNFRSDDGIDLINHLISMSKAIRDPDYINEHPDLSLLCNNGTHEKGSLMGLIEITTRILEDMSECFSPRMEYGAFCYLLDPVDKYLIRAFMQGIYDNRAEDNNIEYPLILSIRDRNRLIIGLFIGDLSREYYLIEIVGMEITIYVYGFYSHLLPSVTGLLAPLSVIWRKNYSISGRSREEIGVPLLFESGSFIARSYDDAMLFLSDTGYHLIRNKSGFYSCGKISG
jgi:hypothetical protein